MANLDAPPNSWQPKFGLTKGDASDWWAWNYPKFQAIGMTDGDVDHRNSCLWQDRVPEELEFDRISDKPSAEVNQEQSMIKETCRMIFPPKYAPFMEAERVCRHCSRYSLFKGIIDHECDCCARTAEEIEDELPILVCGCDECCKAYESV
jgi:hypothetical protein